MSEEAGEEVQQRPHRAGIWRAVSAESFESDRLEAFSDAIFSIAATLLVLDIAIDDSSRGHLWHKILDQWPSYMAYATSFLTIGGLWMVHHSIFRRVKSADGTVMRIILLLLMVVAFLPFPNQLMALAIHNRDAERDAVIFYGATLFLISLLMSMLIRQIQSSPEVEVDAESVDFFKIAGHRTTPNLGYYLVLVAAAFAVPRVSAIGLFVVAAIGISRPG